MWNKVVFLIGVLMAIIIVLIEINKAFGAIVTLFAIAMLFIAIGLAFD